MLEEIKSAFPAFYAFLTNLEQDKTTNIDYGAYDVLPGATEAEIEQIEAVLHLPLTESYKRFLRCTRGLSVLGGYVSLDAEHPYFHDWSGRPGPHPPSQGMLCFARCSWLADGDDVLFDVHQGLQEGEYPVVYYAHDGDPVIRTIARSFEEWIEQWLLATFGGNEIESFLLRPSASSAPDREEQLQDRTSPEAPTKKRSFWSSLFKRR